MTLIKLKRKHGILTGVWTIDKDVYKELHILISHTILENVGVCTHTGREVEYLDPM